MNAAPKSVSKKSVKKTEETVAAPAPVVAATTAPTKGKKAAKEVVATPVVATPEPVAAAPVEVEAVAEEARLETEVKTVTSKLMALRELVSELVTEAKRLEKKATKLQKVADKRRRKSKATAEGDASKPARVSIFQVPQNISPELCSFMGMTPGSQESRSNVTKFVTTYVKNNNLKNKHDINPDAKLRTLLRLTPADKLTYFNLQKYLNVHYPKAAPAAAQ